MSIILSYCTDYLHCEFSSLASSTSSRNLLDDSIVTMDGLKPAENLGNDNFLIV